MTTAARKSRKSSTRKSRKSSPAKRAAVGTEVRTPSGRRYVIEDILVAKARTPRLCVLRPLEASAAEGPRRLLLPETLVKTG